MAPKTHLDSKMASQMDPKTLPKASQMRPRSLFVFGRLSKALFWISGAARGALWEPFGSLFRGIFFQSPVPGALCPKSFGLGRHNKSALLGVQAHPETTKKRARNAHPNAAAKERAQNHEKQPVLAREREARFLLEKLRST